MAKHPQNMFCCGCGVVIVHLCKHTEASSATKFAETRKKYHRARGFLRKRYLGIFPVLMLLYLELEIHISISLARLT